jgi:hypothetical protein
LEIVSSLVGTWKKKTENPAGSSLGSHHKAIKPLKVDGRSWRLVLYGFASEQVWKTMAYALHRKTWILKQRTKWQLPYYIRKFIFKTMR